MEELKWKKKEPVISVEELLQKTRGTLIENELLCDECVVFNRRMKSEIMKKILLSAIAFMMSVVFVLGCSAKKQLVSEDTEMHN